MKHVVSTISSESESGEQERKLRQVSLQRTIHKEACSKEVRVRVRRETETETERISEELFFVHFQRLRSSTLLHVPRYSPPNQVCSIHNPNAKESV